MAYVVATPTQVSVTSNAAVLADTGASGGTGPYTYQWYRSTTTGFTPGGGNILTGKTSLSLSDSGLIPNTIYYYKLVSTDTGNSNTTATSAQLAVTTAAQQLSQNQFQQSPIVGQVDLLIDYDTVAVQIDSTQATALYAGSAVKVVDSSGGAPKVIGCAADSDDVFGFINYDVKNVSFVAGDACEISQAGNVMWLYASTAVARGARVELDLVSPGTVAAKGTNSGSDVVGWAYDKASAYGDLIRVRLINPSFTKS